MPTKKKLFINISSEGKLWKNIIVVEIKRKNPENRNLSREKSRSIGTLHY